jgi:hypothetical protein
MPMMEAAMNDVIGTLDKFHLGVSADGENCVMVFIDEAQRSINCVANYAEFNAFISNLNRAANEMARRRSVLGEEDNEGTRLETMNVASAAFEMNQDAGYIEGALVGDSGEVVGIRMRPDVAWQLTRAMLMSAPAVSTC